MLTYRCACKINVLTVNIRPVPHVCKLWNIDTILLMKISVGSPAFPKIMMLVLYVFVAWVSGLE
jgi:hypothetical protein